MASVAVLHPQDVFHHHHHHHHHRSSLISPAMKSRRRFTNPSPPTSTNPPANNNNNNRRSSPSKRRKRSPTKKDTFPLKEVDHNTTTTTTTTKPRAKPKPTTASNSKTNNLVMGQVKILKRGETLQSPTPLSTSPPSDSPATSKKVSHVTAIKKKIGASDDDLLVLSSAGRMGPAEPDLFPKQIRFPDCYAGSAFVTSPPPSSLPVPAFFKKKNLVVGDDKNNSTSTSSTNDATNDLLKLLRLDLS